jgi:formamidase
MCFNRLHPDIPMAAWANPGEIVLFDTPTSTADIKQKDLLEENLAFSPSIEYIGTLHQLAGPLGVYGANAGDKVAIVSRHAQRRI